MQMLADDMWNVLTKTIATSRNLDVETLKKLANNLDLSLPEEALKHKLVDALIYEDEMEAKFAEYGVKPSVGNNDYNILSLGDYISLNPEVIDYNSPAIGVVYAEGEIFDGEGDDDNVYSANLVKLLQKARKNNNIKAVVLRVNSPGGSALASDVIWREVELLRKEKPVIVSMGSAAASGGYYISAGADAIITNELTITGSIGVFGLLVEGKNMLNEKLGITTDVVKTNPSADFGDNILGIGTRKITETERKAMLRSVDKVYETFVSRVSNGRNLPKEKVLDIAQGRVWSGSRAIELGLADANGGLREAIALAINSAGISDNYSIIEILEELPPVIQLIKEMGTQVKAAVANQEVAEITKLYNLLKRELAREGVQAYCPYSFSIN
jgi:protease-4